MLTNYSSNMASDKISLKVLVCHKGSILSNWRNGDDITISLKKEWSLFKFYLLAADETTDIMNSAHVGVFIRRITFNFQIREGLQCLKYMHGTTTGEDIFGEINQQIMILIFHIKN